MSKVTPQDVYLKKVQTDYKAYCFHVFNNGRDLSDKKQLAWIPSRFHVFLADTIQEFLEEETGNAFDILVLSTPPQHGKSKSVTETLPSWYFWKHPEHRVIESHITRHLHQISAKETKKR